MDGASFICLIPGYDRYFVVCETLDIEMITVDFLDDGPDMDAIERHVADKPPIKGIGAVPKDLNPNGIAYSTEVVARLAEMQTAARGFRII